MEEPKYITVGQLKKKLGKYPDHMPVVGIDNEFITDHLEISTLKQLIIAPKAESSSQEK